MKFKFGQDAESLLRPTSMNSIDNSRTSGILSLHQLLYNELMREKDCGQQKGSLCSLPTSANVILISAHHYTQNVVSVEQFQQLSNEVYPPKRNSKYLYLFICIHVVTSSNIGLNVKFQLKSMHVPSVTREIIIIIIIRRGYSNTKHKLLLTKSAISNFCDYASLSNVFRLKQSLCHGLLAHRE